MGLAAHNIGAGEALLGPGQLRRLAEQLGAPLLSTNVRDRAGASVGPADADRNRCRPPGGAAGRARSTLRHGRVAGLAASPGGARCTPRRRQARRRDRFGLSAGRRVAPACRGPARGRCGRRRADRPADHPEISGRHALGLGHPARKVFGPPRRPGARIARPLDRQHHRIGRDFADDAEQAENIRRFREELARRDFSPQETSLAAPQPAQLPAGFAVAGTAVCAKCHEEEDRRWRKSKHAAAWKTLEEKGSHVDPDCQHCHVTGYGVSGGFRSLRQSAPVVNVGCESCHGPSAGHAREPKRPTAYFAQAKDRCIDCHDRENSPHFDYAKYWEAIRHGKPK